MNLLNKLTIKNLKLNKKRSIVTIVGIILAVALISALSSMYTSFIDSAIEYETSIKGNYHIAFKDVNTSDVETIDKNSKIKQISIVADIGYCNTYSTVNEYKPYLFIKAFDNNALNNLCSELIEGTLPCNENEIIIPEHLKKDGQLDIKVGDLIKINIGNRLSNNQILDQNTPYELDVVETIENISSKTYKVVGKCKRPITLIEPYSAPGYTLITYLDNYQEYDNVDIYALYNNKGIKDFVKVSANILEIDENILMKVYDNSMFNSDADFDLVSDTLKKAKYTYESNDYLIKLQTNPLSISTMMDLSVIVVVVLIIIVITSVLCIKNSFDISITEKIKQYGMLKSIGATKKQIRNNVIFEATILGVIGIPIGVISGLFAAYILVKISNALLSNSLVDELVFSISILAILLSIALGFITIYLSALSSSNKASKVSPIESIRNSGELIIENKTIKTSKLLQSLFTIGGVLAIKNTKRNKKKYKTTTISLSLSILSFISLFYFTSATKQGLDKEFNNIKANYSVTMNEYYKNVSLIDKVINLDEINDYSIYRQTLFQIYNPKFASDYIDDTSNGINLVALDKHAYQVYLKQLGLKYEDVSDKVILFDNYIKEVVDEKGKQSSKNAHKYDYVSGDKIRGLVSSYVDETIEMIQIDLQIVEVSDKYPIGGTNKEPSLIVSDDFIEKQGILIEPTTIYFDSSDADSLQKQVEDILDGVFVSSNNISKRKTQQDNVLLLIDIFAYGFISVISLIGVTNIFNTITTSMELRRQEFAMLKSIGMTTKEFSRMINLESIFIGTKSLFYGVTIGSALAYFLYIYSDIPDGFKYPILAVLICIIVVFVLIVSLMKYSLNKIQKHNIIETIRNENI